MRKKTELRLSIEKFLDDTDEFRDDWMSVPYSSQRERNKITSMIYSMKRSGYRFGSIDHDRMATIIWIRRVLE